MKNQIIKIVLLSSFVFCFFNTAHAALSIETTVDVPANCTAIDTDGVTHNYGSSSSYLAICALEAAENNGSGIAAQLSNQYPDFGLFITTINSTAADANHYWAIYQNTNFANLGVTSLPIATGDTIIFQLTDSSNPSYPPPLDSTLDQVTLHINSLIPSGPVGSGGGQLNDSTPSSTSTNTASASSITPTITTPPAKPSFDTKKALDYLLAEQKSDGSFGDELYTDWASLALATGENQTQTLQLVKYFSQSSVDSSNLTDYERHAMALMSLGLNPYNTNGENYVSKIVSSFDGKQFGDPTEDNDDIFALIVLQNAGYTQNDSIISSDINFVLSTQGADGSWNSSVDMTGAAMEALSAFSGTGQVKDALTKAESYLEQNQKDDGSWNDNASSTAWAIEGILAQNEKPTDWSSKNGGNTPLDYLATVQDTDGGVKDSDLNTKIWETEYVVSALSGKTWNQIMQTYAKQDSPAPTGTLPAPATASTTNTVSLKTTDHKIALAHKKTTSTPQIVTPAIENTASVINAVTPTPNPSKNWFMALLEKIF
jgi:hypothetical protein